MSALRTLIEMARVYPYTAAWNATGQPAAAVPAGFTADGLPLSVQLVGRPGDEATLSRSPPRSRPSAPGRTAARRLA